MRKSIISLAVGLLFCGLPTLAQESQEAVVEIVETAEVQPAAQTSDVTINFDENGNATIVYDNGKKTVIVDKEEYASEKKRGLSDLKIAKNKEINDADGAGLGVTVMAMCIVLLALIVLSILFMMFGKLFARKQSQKKKEAHGISADEDHDEDHDSGETIAAIAMALDEHFNSKHDMEDTVLTIRRMKRAYSPWNSKIYNMRELPSRR